MVSAQALDGARGDAALPEADEPEAGDAAVGEQMKLLVRNLVEAMDVAEIFLGELLEPDVGALGHEDDVGHPGLVGGEVFVFVERGLIAGGVFLAAELVVADELVADEAHASPGGRAVAELIRAGGMETHPDSEVLFAQDIDGEQNAANVCVEIRGPLLADEVELADEGVGRCEERRAEGVEEAADAGRDGRARAEVVGEGGGDVGVDGLLFEDGVFEELVEGLERGVDVGDPEHQQLFERGLAVGQAVGGAGEPLGGGGFAAEDGGVRELLGEGEQEPFELLRGDLGREPANGLGEDVGVDLLAVAGDECVAELIDEAHGEEGAGVQRAGRVGIGAAGLVERLGQLPARRDIGEDDVAGIAEQQVVDLG